MTQKASSPEAEHLNFFSLAKTMPLAGRHEAPVVEQLGIGRQPLADFVIGRPQIMKLPSGVGGFNFGGEGDERRDVAACSAADENHLGKLFFHFHI